MAGTIRREGAARLFWGFALLCCAAALVRWPKESAAAVKEGLELCFNVILPSLFPFFILTSLVVSLGLAGYLGRLLEPVMGPLFHLGGPCAAALALGLIGGYPVGARTALELYEGGQCSRDECERLLAFCNNAGPAFILGAVGAGVFADSRVGLLLWGVHAAASLCVGLLFRFYHASSWRKSGGARRPITACRFSEAFTGAVTGAVGSTLNICAFVVTFAVLLRLLFLSGLLPGLARALGQLLAPLGFDELWGRRLLTGVLELSSGVGTLAGEGSLSGRASMAAFFLGWAGVSVHCQVLSFLGRSGLSTKTYFAGKLLHGLLSALFTSLLFRLLPLEGTVAGYLTEQVEGIAGVDFSTALTVSTAAAWLLFLLFFALAVLGSKRGRVRHA